ncbi:hypothetical protein GQ457_09G020880 [Hibiscus cannabinus]
MFDLAINTTLDLKTLKVSAYPSTRLEFPHTLFPRANAICFFSGKEFPRFLLSSLFGGLSRDLDVNSVEIKDSSASLHQEFKLLISPVKIQDWRFFRLTEEQGFFDSKVCRLVRESLRIKKTHSRGGGKIERNQEQDAKALFILQQTVHEVVFYQIVAATTLKEVWSILQTKFQGGSKVIVVKLQALRHDYETLCMKSGETIVDFLSREKAIISQMRSYGEQISDEMIIAKVLRSLTLKFDLVVAAIEESKDLLVLFVDELMGSLQAHESRINRSLEKNEENAF